MKRQREMEGYLEMENAVVAAIFQVGLTQSSPKSLISLMPETPELTREHIKSHLQKYRIQSEKSNEQFIEFFDKHLRTEFYQFLTEYEKSVEVATTLEDVEHGTRVVTDTLDLDHSSGTTEASRSDETLSASSTTVSLNDERKKLKAEFDNVYKESLGVKSALVDITARPFPTLPN